MKHNEERDDIHERVFNNIPHFVKKILQAKCLNYGFVMNNDNLFIS